MPSEKLAATFTQRLSSLEDTLSTNRHIVRPISRSVLLRSHSSNVVLVHDTSTFSVNIEAQGFSGLIGLGPNSGSKIWDEISGTSGYSVLNRIFVENTVSSPFITFYLDRANGTTVSNTGMMTIAEVLPQYSSITSYTRLKVDKVHRLTDADQHWQILTDTNGFIGPDGNTIALNSIVPSAPDGQLVAVLDTGFTLTQVPRYVSDAIYGRVPGAVFDEKNQFWTVPCDSLINVSLKFGGVEIPIHPLDTVMSEFAYEDANGKSACIGSVSSPTPITFYFQPGSPFSSSQSPPRSVSSANMTWFSECRSVSAPWPPLDHI